jgi:hypothetical protein
VERLTLYKHVVRTSLTCVQVTIAQLELQATIVNYTVPSASAHAYLQVYKSVHNQQRVRCVARWCVSCVQAKTRNTSEFPFLASEKVSVFMDGSFITRTRLRNISPGEVCEVCNASVPTHSLATGLQHLPRRQSERACGVQIDKNQR